MDRPELPILRFGKEYKSLDKAELTNAFTGDSVATVSLANGGIVRRDLRRVAKSRQMLRDLSCDRLLEICARAADIFAGESIPLNDGGDRQTPEDYIRVLSDTTGLPHALCRRNMDKIVYVLQEMPTILRGLTRGMDLKVLDAGMGSQAGVRVSYFAATDSLGVVLPSNSPGVNSLWLPAIPLKIPVVIKPGREEPWTPYRIMRAFIEAGCPAEAFGFYPTDHDGSAAILDSCGRALLFGDQSTVERYANNPAVEVHGPGTSKLVIGEDRIEDWREYIDVIVDSIVSNGGRSCVNASGVVVPKYGKEIAEAIAERLAAVGPRDPEDAEATLAGFANPQVAEAIDQAVDEGLKVDGARDVTSQVRTGSRRVEFRGGEYLLPTLIHCDSFDHPLANREFLFPYASVVEVSQEKTLDSIGESLVVTAITDDESFVEQLLASPLISRLNIGPLPTWHVEWDQPHEGNLFEFLYRRRAIQLAPTSVS